MVKVGDRVRFLNAVGGGVVKRVSKSVAMVEEEDGFETPVLLHECVVIEPAPVRPAPEKQEVYTPQRAQAAAAVSPVAQPVETPEGEALSLWLGFLPADARNLSAGTFDCYLVNDSNYTLFFTLSNACGAEWTARYAGTVEPNTKRRLEQFGREQLGELEQLVVQYLPYKKGKPFDLKPAGSVRLKLDTVKFYKLHSFRENDYFDEPALLVPVVRRDLPERLLEISARELEAAMREKQRPEASPARPSESDPLVVDLHSGELLDTTAGMGNAEILNYQLDRFRETMELYRHRKGMRIVFIHGKGNGVLRKALLAELQRKYKNAEAQDASFREYGFGATLVVVR